MFATKGDGALGAGRGVIVGGGGVGGNGVTGGGGVGVSFVVSAPAATAQ